MITIGVEIPYLEFKLSPSDLVRVRLYKELYINDFKWEKHLHLLLMTVSLNEFLHFLVNRSQNNPYDSLKLKIIISVPACFSNL